MSSIQKTYNKSDGKTWYLSENGQRREVTFKPSDSQATEMKKNERIMAKGGPSASTAEQKAADTAQARNAKLYDILTKKANGK